jgi:hypothetical protein
MSGCLFSGNAMTKEAVYPPQKFQAGYHTFGISKKDLPPADNFFTGAGGRNFPAGKRPRVITPRPG